MDENNDEYFLAAIKSSDPKNMTIYSLGTVGIKIRIKYDFEVWRKENMLAKYPEFGFDYNAPRRIPDNLGEIAFLFLCYLH